MKVRGCDLEARIRLEAVIQRDDVQDVQVLALVLVDALDLHVEQRVRIDRRRRCGSRAMPAELSLLARLMARQSLWNAGILGELLQLARAASRSLIQPSPMASQISSARRGLVSASQRRGVTPLVLLLNFSGHSS